MTHGLKGDTLSCCQFSSDSENMCVTLLYHLSYKPVLALSRRFELRSPEATPKGEPPLPDHTYVDLLAFRFPQPVNAESVCCG